jgi:8-oxo-dGTP pyrophosphatase MutT (NUDIX family)
MLMFAAHRRASTLRSFAGDTSLPGGKMDPEDRTIEDTAVSLLVRTTPVSSVANSY